MALRTICSATASLAFLLVPTLLDAQAATADSTAAVQEVLEQSIRDCEAHVPLLEGHAYMSLFMTVFITALGALVGFLKTQAHPWVRIVAVTGGIAISSLTYVHTELYPRTHKALFPNADKAREVARRAKRFLSQTQPPDPNDADAYGKYTASFNDILAPCDNLDEGLHGPPVLLFGFFGAAPAHAGVLAKLRGGPGWLTSPPDDPGFAYFVGIAHERTVETARHESLETARMQIREYVLRQLASEGLAADDDSLGSTLAAELANSAGLVDTAVERDSESELFAHYTLLRLPRAEIKRKLALGFAPTGNRPNVVAEGKDSPFNHYEARRQEVYARILDEMRHTLPADQYRRFLDARELRKTARAVQAIAALESLVADNPALFLAWYNLAIAYADAERDANADRAYGRAIALEGSQALGDASVYSSYGRYLFRRGEFSRAIPLLEQAMVIEPGHVYAARYLEEAKKQVSGNGDAFSR
jgi:tetratricopeptide (TPR) repeat protein